MAVDLTTTMKNKFKTMLRSRMTDHNSANRVGSQWIYPDKPRVDLTKNSYPRISVLDDNESREIMDIAENTQKTSRIAFWIYVWGNPDDPMLLTISSVVYEGVYLLDYIVEELKTEIEDHFSDLRAATPCPHDYNIVRVRDVPDDEGIGRLIKEVVVEVQWE